MKIKSSSLTKRNMQKFVRYAEGAKMYSMGLSKFQELAKDAKACYKVGQLVLVNTEILDEYMEQFIEKPVEMKHPLWKED